MWKIHGNYYDLESFLEIHPGGKLILEQSKGDNDLTAAFESYHAMSDMEKIKKIMKKYEIKGKNYSSEFNFDKKMFYYKLKDKVKNYFETKKINHHSNLFWFVKSTFQFVIYLSSFIISCYMTNIPIYYRYVLSLISGHMFIQYGFTVMHDASHHAISSNSKINEILANIWNSLALWNNNIWYKHHCIMHHSFTGSKLDPDTIHFYPFIRKSIQESAKKYIKYSNLRAIFFINIFPGMWLGQAFAYLNGIIKMRLWRMPLDIRSNLLEMLLKFFTIFSLLYSRNIFVIFCYVIACNVTYCLCILPDHDTFETHQNIIHDIKKADWGELQVCNSANFSTNNKIINNCFGGINFQIEHHLFPTICHVHFPEISIIVKKMCEEHGIPYVEHKSVFSAINSVLRNFEVISQGQTISS